MLHRCDNPACVNLDHLFVGDKYDNNLDCAKKGRRPHGEGHPGAKLTEDQVLDIFRSNETGAQLARRHGISQMTISDIRRGVSWNHITLAPRVRRIQEARIRGAQVAT